MTKKEAYWTIGTALFILVLLILAFTGVNETAAILLLLGGFYFIPSMIAWNKPFADQVIAVNLLLGWSIIGWIVALVWALKPVQKPTRKETAMEMDYQGRKIQSESIADELGKLKSLHHNGILTDDEYEQAKLKVLS